MFWLLKRLFLFSVYFAIQFFLYKRTLLFFSEPAGDEKRRKRVTAWVRAFFIGISLPLLLQVSPESRADLPKLLVVLLLYPLEIWMPSSMFIFFLLAGKDALRALTQRTMARRKVVEAAIREPGPAVPTRREFMRFASGALATAPIAAFTYGMSISKTNFTIEKVSIPIKELPKSLEGLRICQLTDIHYESFLFPEDLIYVVNMANELSPDLTFLTGDFLTEDRRLTEPFIEVFRSLKAREGIYGCLGNHEEYTRTQEIFTRGFRKAGIEILRDTMTDLNIRGEKLRLAGINWVGRTLRAGAVRTIQSTTAPYPTILLSHQPNMFPIAAAAGIDLTVSGHTHGGQIAIELGAARISLSQLVSPFSAGRYTQGHSQLYVSRGIGTIALPLRINAPPEVTLIELVRAERVT